ncbi:hypothetical protein AC629_42550 [Bradyrhizobium sp. NAS80.1]|nr:hypothetical protein AC629_42550 [Bradyrhizobium sp. NAS80.1]
MQTDNGQPFPKYRSSADVHALKIQSITVNPDNGQEIVTFADGYYGPLTLPAGALADISADVEGSYLVAEGPDWAVIPGARFEAHFKRVD